MRLSRLSACNRDATSNTSAAAKSVFFRRGRKQKEKGQMGCELAQGNQK